MGKEHPSAAVPLQTQGIHDILGRFARGHSSGIFFKKMTYNLAASKTSDMNYHYIAFRSENYL
jgi:hypothetical protein